MRSTFLLFAFIFCSVFTLGQEFKNYPFSADTISNRTVVIKDTLGYDSLFQEFYSNGQLFYQMPYHNGLQNGWSEQFHRNGVVSGKGLWVNGKTVDGINIYFWDDGSIQERGYYKNGHPIGKWYSFARDGIPISLRIYNRKGELVRQKSWNWEKKKWEKCGFY